MKSAVKNLLDAMTSPDALAIYSSAALPVQGLGMSRSKLGANLSASLFGNVVLDTNLDPDLTAHYASLGMAPRQIFVAQPDLAEVKGAVADSGFKTLYTQGKSAALDAFGAEAGLARGFYDFAEETYLAVFARDFLLMTAARPDALLKTCWLADFPEQSFAAVSAEADRFGEGFLFRQRFSVNGNDLTRIRTNAEFRQAVSRLDARTTLVVPTVPPSKVVLDLEITFAVSAAGPQLLGISKQLNERQRHFGSESLDLGPRLGTLVRDQLDSINAALIDHGFTSGVLGLDAFLIQHDGQSHVIPYDLNPCSAQAFFPTLATARLERNLGQRYFHRNRFFMVPAAMPFADFKARFDDLLLSRQESEAGIFPLMFDSLSAGGSTGPARTLIMTLIVGPDADACNQLEAKLYDRLSRIARVSRLFF